MLKKRFGSTGTMVSCLGIGGMSFAEPYGATSDEASLAVLDRAYEAGVTHIDTANVYGMGRSETVIGRWLAAHPGRRDGLFIATKAGITRTEDGKRLHRNDMAHLEAELDASLGRLGVDHVDLFYVHRRDPKVPIEELTGGLAGLVEKGKVGSIGFSEIAPSSLRKAHKVHPIAAVQSEYSLSTRSPEMGLVQTCAELGVALVAFSPVGRSLLTDDPLPAGVVADAPILRTMPRFQEPNYSANLELVWGLRSFASELGLPTAALAIAWLLTRGAHVFPIPGTRSVAHFEEYLAGFTAQLSDDEIARIEEILPIGWAHGDRYGPDQWVGPERYC